VIRLLIVTYNDFGSHIIDAAAHILGSYPEFLKTQRVGYDDTPEKLEVEIQQKLDQLKNTEGIIILTDVFGATHTNIALKFVSKGNISLVSGLNLPMLLRIMNYRHLDLASLVDKAVKGGQEGIKNSCMSAPECNNGPL